MLPRFVNEVTLTDGTCIDSRMWECSSPWHKMEYPQTWPHRPATPILRRLRQEDSFEFEDILGYRPCLRNKTNIYLFIYLLVFWEVLLPQLPWAEVAMGRHACDQVQQRCSLCSHVAFQRFEASPVKLLDFPPRQPEREGRKMNLISMLSELKENQQKRYPPKGQANSHQLCIYRCHQVFAAILQNKE